MITCDCDPNVKQPDIDETCQLVRDISAFLDEWEWSLPPRAGVAELQSRARALGLSDTRDFEDIERNNRGE